MKIAAAITLCLPIAIALVLAPMGAQVALPPPVSTSSLTGAAPKFSIISDINSGSFGYRWMSQSTPSSARNWAMVTEILAYGDMALLQSSAKGGDPVAAGAIKLYFNASGLPRITGLPVAANEAAAVTAGLATGDLYQTSTGELRIKL
jgi:hypothetical protein